MFLNGIALPFLTGASEPLINSAPTATPLGAIMYILSPSAYKRSAIFAVLFGSY